MERNLLFISHSTPDDNYYAAWLASKLRLVGYDVWVDLNDLHKGASFWPKIQRTIDENSIRCLAIVTKSYIEKAAQDRSGVLNEITCACDVRGINNFIIPLRFENIPFSLFPIQIRPINGIDFSGNWAEGLRTLLKQLNEDGVQATVSSFNPLGFWLSSKNYNEMLTNNPETYLSNWFKLDLPEYLYFHHPSLFSDLEINKMKELIPFKVFGDKIVCFHDKNQMPSSIVLDSSLAVPIHSFLSGRPYAVDQATVVAEPYKLLIEIINLAFEMCALSRSLEAFEMAHGKAFYFPYNEANKGWVSLPGPPRRLKKIMGVFRKDNWWLLGLSHHSYLRPFPYVKVVTHILFADKEGKFHSKDVQHGLRRGFSTGPKNKDWLDYQSAFITKMAGGEDFLTLVKPAEIGLRMHALPFTIQSDVGYLEPTTIEVQNDE